MTDTATAPHPTSPTTGPLRTCVACRRSRPRDELARLARTPQGVRYDRSRGAPGRGANLCPDTTCIDRAARRDAAALRRALRGAPVREIREALDALRSDLHHPDPPAARGEHHRD